MIGKAFAVLLRRQDGKCYYTDTIMLWDNYGKGKGKSNPDSMTVDRLTPERGYVRGNVVLCTYKTNTSKGDRTETDFYAFCARILSTKDQRQAGKPP